MENATNLLKTEILSNRQRTTYKTSIFTVDERCARVEARIDSVSLCNFDRQTNVDRCDERNRAFDAFHSQPGRIQPRLAVASEEENRMKRR